MDYGSINAKVKFRKGKLLKGDDYLSLSQLKSVEQVLAALGEYDAYSSLAARVSAAGGINRHILEENMTVELKADFHSIYRFISDYSIKKFLYALSLKREALIPNPPSSIYMEGTNAFDMEISSDLHYYTNLWRSIKKHLTGENRKIMADIAGTEIDMQNIIWILRLKKYYNMKAANIYKYLIPINYRLVPAKVTSIVETHGIKEVYSQISETPYGGVFGEDINWTEIYNKAMGSAYSKHLSKTDTLACTVDYLYRKQKEADNIISLTEGVRYSLCPDEIMNFIYI